MYYAHSQQGLETEFWHKLLDHLNGSASLASHFADQFGAAGLGSILGLLHDVGKYSHRFQQRLLGANLQIDHSTAGARVAVERLGTVGKLLAYAVAGHHSGMPDGGSIADEASLEYRLTAKPLADFSKYATEVVLPQTAHRLPIRLTDKASAGFSTQFLIRMLFSCLVDADFLDTESALNPEKGAYRGAPGNIAALERDLSNHMSRLKSGVSDTTVNRWRARVLDDCLAAADASQGMFTLTVPTGGGKTLSSLAFALKHALRHGLTRVIYVIPFTSIIEQNAAVFRSVVGDEAILEHHSNYLPSQDDGEEHADARKKLSLAEENWDAPLIVTTNVQFFESLFSNKTSRCRKLHNITKSVVILDEAQMLPISLLKPCVRSLAELAHNYHVSVVLCSATQPVLHKILPEGISTREIVKAPEAIYAALKRTRVIDRGTLTDEQLAEDVTSRHQALCIVNTRGHARQVFESLGADGRKYHLSAAMCPVHRSSTLAEIRCRLKHGSSCRVVSTQIVEAGVDVDFPVVYRAIAGLDSIAQAAGRCNREGKLDHGDVHVFVPSNGQGLSHPWFKRTASVARRLLDKGLDPLSPEAMQEYFRELYFYEGEGLDKYGILASLEQGARSLSFPFAEVAGKFKIIEEQTVGVIIPYDCKCRDLVEATRKSRAPWRDARQLQQYTVSVWRNDLVSLLEANAVEVIDNRYLVLKDMSLYSRDFGLSPGSRSVQEVNALIV